MPKADICSATKLFLFDHIVGTASSDGGTVSPSALTVLRLMTSSTFDGLLDRQVSRFVTFEAELLGVVAPLPDGRDGDVVLFGRH